MKTLFAISTLVFVSLCGAQTSIEVAPPYVPNRTSAFNSPRAPDLSWLDGEPLAQLCRDETKSPGRLQAPGADELSCAGKSYKTLIQSSEFLALAPDARHKILRRWMQSDAKSRAYADGDTAAVWRQDMSAVEIDYAKRFSQPLPCDCFWLTLTLPIALVWSTYFAATWVWNGHGQSSGQALARPAHLSPSAPGRRRPSIGALIFKNLFSRRASRALVVVTTAYAFVVCAVWLTQSPLFGGYAFLLACYWY